MLLVAGCVWDRGSCYRQTMLNSEWLHSHVPYAKAHTIFMNETNSSMKVLWILMSTRNFPRCRATNYFLIKRFIYCRLHFNIRKKNLRNGRVSQKGSRLLNSNLKNADKQERQRNYERKLAKNDIGFKFFPSQSFQLKCAFSLK